MVDATISRVYREQVQKVKISSGPQLWGGKRLVDVRGRGSEWEDFGETTEKAVGVQITTGYIVYMYS